MKLRKTVLSLFAAVAVGVGAYAASVTTRPANVAPAISDNATQALMEWLQVPAGERAAITAHDPQFAQSLKSLRATVAARRTDLAAALDDPKAADATIRARLEALLTANAELERHVADYLLTVRHHLTADQQRKLFGLCAEGVRQGPNCPWRIGSDDLTPGGGRGLGRGGAGGGGFGPGGGGFGPGRGQGRGPNRP